MVDRQDFYTILGVPRTATESEIRRAFRSRAKSLHPDSKPAGDSEGAQSEFTLLTEAYETLKDQGRRSAYDDDLAVLDGLTSKDRGHGRSRHAFARGLATGLLIAGLFAGGKIYLDRSGSTLGNFKNQDSLSVQSTDRLAAKDDNRQSSGQPETLTEPSRFAERQADSSLPDKSGPVVQQADDAVNKDGSGRASTEEPPSALEASSQKNKDPIRAQPNPQLPDEAVQPETGIPHSGLTGAILSIEHGLDTEDGSTAYQIVSLVNSARSIEELSEAASLVRRPESRELIATRIAALKEQQTKHLSASAANLHAGDDPGAVPHARGAEPGSIEIATGPPAGGFTLRLTPGKGLTESFSDCSNCPEMVVIPQGQAVIGSRIDTANFRAEEAPAHKVSFHKPLAVSKRGISAENWRPCVDAGVCRPTLSSILTAGPGVPATRVSWFDAKDYAGWLSRSTGRRYRLLSEAEWEYAAQAGAAFNHASGGEAKPEFPPAGPLTELSLSRFGGGARRWIAAKPNYWGLHDLPGNVLEWVEDCWHPNYAQAPFDGAPWLSGNGGDCAYRVVRGTPAANSDFGKKRFSARAREFADASSPTLGFRVARELPQPAKTALGSLPASNAKTLPRD